MKTLTWRPVSAGREYNYVKPRFKKKRSHNNGIKSHIQEIKSQNFEIESHNYEIEGQNYEVKV